MSQLDHLSTHSFSRSSPAIISLGNGVWLDEIRAAGKDIVKDVPGGSVTFGVLGARLFAPENSQVIRLAFNAGHDFPESVIDIFRDWQVDLDVRRIADKPSSRGIVFYEEGNANRKGFQRVTDPMPVEIQDLEFTPHPGTAFHFFGTAEYLANQTRALHARYRSNDDTATPLIVWEPHAKSCRPDTLQEHLYAVKRCQIFSPNHEELHGFFGDPVEDFDTLRVETEAQIFVESGIGNSSSTAWIIVRAAEHGCLLMSKGQDPLWLPSFYPSGSGEVVDPTGAGNAFLGGLIMGWHETKSAVEAAAYGMIAASFALEQVGLPKRECDSEESGHQERWNCQLVRARLREYQERLSTQ